MKKVASLLAIAALIACSETENVADANDDDIVAQEESSSSITEEQPVSQRVLESSSSVSSSSGLSSSIISSSSLASIDSIIIPELGSVCGSPSLVTQKKNDPYERFVSDRTAKLVSNGASEQEAAETAKQELYKALGLDTLLNSSTFSAYSIKDAINYLFLRDETLTFILVNSFAKKGTLDRAEFCGIWEDVPWESNSYRASETIEVWAEDVGIRGCAYDERDVYEPYLIFSNIHRKCLDLPYCDEKLYGSVKHASFEDYIWDAVYVCSERGWSVIKNYDKDIEDKPCDEVGKMFKSESVEERYYVCKEDGWNVTTKTAYETKDIPCDAPLKLVASPTVDTLFYLCKDSEWKIASQMEIETNEIPCDSVGKIVESKKEVCSYCRRPYYICRETGWDIATEREADIGERACDAEGKTIQGIVDTNMYYVCYNNAWTEFYNTPCDTNNKRMIDPEWKNLNRYICYNGTWRRLSEWSCEYPKEYFFNPDIEYGTFTDDRDGEVYKTVEVFGKTWMAENMRFVTDSADQSVPVEDGCEIGGRYYSKDAAKTACPAGWRLPDSTDIYDLYTPEYYGLSRAQQGSYLAQFMSEIGTYCNGYPCNVYGTSILALGYYDPTGDKREGPNMTYYWVYGDRSTEEVIFMHFYNFFISFYPKQQGMYLPVRCVKE